LAIRLHESYVHNFGADDLANRTMMEEEMRRQYPNLFKRREQPGDPPAAEAQGDVQDAEEADEAEEMGITFASQRPITLHALTLKIRGHQVSARGRTYAVAMNTTMRYRTERTATGLRLVMEGNPTVQSPEIEEGLRDRLTAQETAVRNIFEQRLVKSLDREIVRESFTLPGQLEKLGEMAVTDWLADDGWVRMSLLRKSAAGN
jgi:hypothetical protein